MIVFAQYFGHFALLLLALCVTALAARRYRLSHSKNRTIYALMAVFGATVVLSLLNNAAAGGPPGLRQAGLTVLLILAWAGVRQITGWAAQFRYSGTEKLAFRVAQPTQSLQSGDKHRT